MKVLIALLLVTGLEIFQAKAEDGSHVYRENQSFSSYTNSQTIETVPATITCDSGYIAYNNECIKSVVETITTKEVVRCPSGYELSVAGDKCTQIDSYKEEFDAHAVQSPTVNSCPPGYSFDGHECFRADPICPYGYTYNPSDSLCRSQQVTSTETKAPVPRENQSFSSYTNSPTIETVPATITCGSGYIAYNNECIKSEVETITTKEVVRCPSGYELSVAGDKCMQIDSYKEEFDAHAVQSPTVNSCPPGYSFDGHECFRADPICPYGYTYNPSDSLCWSQQVTSTETKAPLLSLPQQPCPFAPPQPCQQYPIPYPSMPMPCPPTHLPLTQPVSPCQLGPRVEVHRPILPTKPNHVTPTFHKRVVPVLPPPPTTYECPSGSKLDARKCVKVATTKRETDVIRECPLGYFRDATTGKCSKQKTRTENGPATFTCADGYGYELEGRICRRREVIVHNQGTEAPKVPNPPSQVVEKDHWIHVNNTIHVPVNINNVNNQTSVVHTATLNPAQATHENTEKEVGVITPEASGEEDKKCCEVVSPRICKRTSNRNWRCFHRRTEQCGSCCKSSRIYLRPQQPVYRPRVMVMPPPHPQMMMVQPPAMYPRDCSSCSYGGPCPSYCNAYDCEANESCSYVNQGSYCSQYGGRACTQDFGCMDGDYCA